METYQPAKALKVLKILHWGLMSGPIFFSIFAIAMITSSDQSQLIDTENILSFLPISFAVMLIPGSYFLFSTGLKERVDKESELSAKIAAYQTAHIIRMAVLEGTALFAIVGAFVSNTYANFTALFFVLLVMVLVTPSPFKLMESLQLSRSELEALGAEDGIE
ncbi:hypothetical protein [Reichenbachiella ulvae]|uniref:DUF2975 domain-containing protein n=1 Tax=Reichenbachiella ulvae TaxID=2980104 RepID=A0ABT3CWG6_9BACT|nr:hypothetical protein [Reichenbachiella ulvae]MCV9387864.1 hypothetical protein [Reichenbachiella ulvae]